MNWVTVNEASLEVHKTKKTIYNWIKKEKIQHKKENDITYVSLEDIKKVANEHRERKSELGILQEKHQELLLQNQLLLQKIEYYQDQLAELKLLENADIKNKRKMMFLEKRINDLYRITKQYEKASLWDRIRGKKYDLKDDEDTKDDESDNYYDTDY